MYTTAGKGQTSDQVGSESRVTLGHKRRKGHAHHTGVASPEGVDTDTSPGMNWT